MDRYGNVIYLTPMVLGAFRVHLGCGPGVFSASFERNDGDNAGRAMRPARKDSNGPRRARAFGDRG